MATEIDQALFEDELSPGYNSFNEALVAAVAAAMRKRREEGKAKMEPPKDDGGDEDTEEKAEDASASEEMAEAAQESPEQGELGLDDGETVEGEVESEEKKETKEDSGKIEDFGEKLGGARKDLYQSYREMMLRVSEDEISSYPLAKLWPQPNYTKLLKEGMEPWRVAILRALREDLGRRPTSKSYKVSRWNHKFLINRRVAEEILDLENNTKSFGDYMFIGSQFSDDTVCKAHIYAELGADIPEKDFHYTVEYFQSPGAVYFEGKKFSDTYAIRENKWKIFGVFDTWTEAREAMITANKKVIDFNRAVQEAYNKRDAAEQGGDQTNPPARNYDKFSILGWRGAKGYWFIGKKYNGEWVEVKKPFKEATEAREYLNSHKDEIQDLFEQFKYVPNLRRTKNLPRTENGNPGRARDITPDEFSETFGFRGVEFGNWVENDKRQKDLNEAYDGLLDLASVLNVPPRALSLCGELGLRFGSNGRGGIHAAKAHYEPDLIAINLTKKAGAGSLAHEWFHAIDHYFNRHVGENHSGVLLTESRNINLLINYEKAMQRFEERTRTTSSRFLEEKREQYNRNTQAVYDNSKIRREVLDKFIGIITSFDFKNQDVKRTYAQRSQAMDKYRSKAYWSTEVEMAARAFEAYVYTKLAERGIRNDYLVNYLTPQEYENEAKKNPARLSNNYPYPVNEELPAIKKAYDELFETIETREAKDGLVELYSSSDYRQSRLENCETVFDEELTEVQMELKNFASMVLGQEVEFYDGPETFHGSYDPLEHKILLNINSEKPVDWVLWHESFHAFSDLEPETYKDLMSYMDAHAPITRQQMEAYKESVNGHDLPDDVVKQELLADAFADMKKRESIAEKMQEKAPGLLGRVSGYFNKVKDMAKEFFFRKEDVRLTEEQFSHFEYAVSQISMDRLNFKSQSILETKGTALSNAHYGNAHKNLRQMTVLDYTPAQQKEFDIRFARKALQNGARPKDVEYVMKNASSLGHDSKVVKEIIAAARKDSRVASGR